MTLVGFKPPTFARVAVRNDGGAKVGYIASVGGKTVLQSPDGRTIATILRFKQMLVMRCGAQGGSFVPRDYE